MITATLAHANTLTRDAVTQQLEWDSEFDASAVGITERDGVVTLTSVRDLRHRIVQAIHRSAEVDARTVSIAIDGSTVMLEGVVGSWVELEAAEKAVMHAPLQTYELC